jgi:F-type H+-transporting ATPase subunit a
MREMSDLTYWMSLFAAETAEHGDKHGGGHATLSMWGLAAYFGLTLLVIFLLMVWAKPGLNGRFFKNPITQGFEQMYLFIEQMAVGIIGSHGRKYIPLLSTLWLVIFVGNLIALFFPTSITADLSFNLALALITVGYVQYEGMAANGFFGHWSHFAGPKLGVAFLWLNLLIFPIEIISEALKNVSLSLRLYGNIDGGHRAADAMNQLGHHLFNIGGLELSVPIGAFLIPVKLLTCVVQALIFTLLTCVYLSLVTSHDHGDEHHSEAHAEHETGSPAPLSAG